MADQRFLPRVFTAALWADFQAGAAETQVYHEFVPLLSRKARYRLALLLSSLRTSLDRQRRRVALSNLRVVFGDEISAKSQVVRLFQADATFTMSSLLLRFGVCVGLLLSAFH